MCILFLCSSGSLKADITVFAAINANTVTKVEALNHFIEGIDRALGEEITAVFLLGKRLKKVALLSQTDILVSLKQFSQSLHFANYLFRHLVDIG